MAAQGLQTLFPLDDTAVMGLREVVPKIPKILARVREARDFALATRPDAVVLIDSPDFTHRIARAVKRADPSIRSINYVAPQVWATRAYRARKMAGYFDLVLALLPFEAPFLRNPWSQIYFRRPSRDRTRRAHERRCRLACAAGHRCRCARAGCSARQPRQRNPLHPARFPRRRAPDRPARARSRHASAHGAPCCHPRARGHAGLANAAPHH